MKKILIASYNLDFGGIEKALLTLLKNLPSEKYEITLLLQEKKGIFLKEVPKYVKIKTYSLSKNTFLLFRKIENRCHLLSYIKRFYHQYDVAICYATYDIPSSILTRYLGKKSIYWVHSDYTQIYREEAALKTFFRKRKIEKFNQVVFVSNEAKNHLLVHYPMLKQKSIVINNLIDDEEIKRLAKEKINDPKNKNQLLFVGRLEESAKGILLLLEVMKKYQAEQQERSLWVIGEGKDLALYQDYVHKNHLKNVHFLGAKKNPYPYMKTSDVMVLPSFYEGFPVVAIEALCLGKKMVTTIDVSSENFKLKEYVYLTKRKEVDLKQKIDEALKDSGKKTFDPKVFNQANLKRIEELLGDDHEI